jgi:FAD/FMN-containing dehydrogenase
VVTAAAAAQPVAAWGRLSATLHHVTAPAQRGDVPALMQQARAAGTPGLAHGLGRSYGDVALNPPGPLWKLHTLDRFIAFDSHTGVLECEAGVSLADIIRVALPRGWFLPVTPGTQFVTVGGAIANDVHGKNHHSMGCFGDHVLELDLCTSAHGLLRCSVTEHVELLAATIGGLGLTGVITRARLQLQPVPGPWVEQQTQAFGSLPEFFALSADAEGAWPYTVAWIDCLATRGQSLRGLLFCGRHVAHDAPLPARPQRSMPATPPVSLVNRASLVAFNTLYWQHHRRHQGQQRLVPWQPFFYPLDSIGQWNRIYGPRGFYQYQCVLPVATQAAALQELLSVIARSGSGSFLGVLKTFGSRPSRGLLSFPMPGATLALDFPNHGQETLRLFDTLNRIVAQAGGRLYPAKDAAMPRTLFEAGYARLAEFIPHRDPAISSAMSRRLMGH